MAKFKVSGIVEPIDFQYIDTPLSAFEEEAEVKAAASLPVIAELNACLTSADRLEVLRSAVAKSRAEFIALYGDPFGCENSQVKDLALAES